MAPGKDSTRQRIIRTAERLFALRGLDQASVRQVNLAAGQRNTSATQYHFGGKAALVEAIFDFRTEQIDRRRVEMLRELPDLTPAADIRPLVEALIRPLADHMDPGADCFYYIRVAAQIIGHPEYQRIARRRNRFGDGIREILQRLAIALPDLPPEVLNDRFGIAIRQIFNELADHQRLHADDPVRTDHTKLLVANLTDMIAAGFSAPLSVQTRLIADRSRQRTA